MIYKCSKCDYTTVVKCNFDRHNNRKKLCYNKNEKDVGYDIPHTDVSVDAHDVPVDNHVKLSYGFDKPPPHNDSSSRMNNANSRNVTDNGTSNQSTYNVMRPLDEEADAREELIESVSRFIEACDQQRQKLGESFYVKDRPFMRNMCCSILSINAIIEAKEREEYLEMDDNNN
jgi:hypothetical protein